MSSSTVASEASPAPARAARRKSTARTPSPSRAASPKAAKSTKAGSAAKPRSARKKKEEKPEEEEEKTVTAAAPKSAEPKKRAPRAKKEPSPKAAAAEEDDDDELEFEGGGAIIFIDEDATEDLQLVQDMMKDTTGVHNVVRVQYIQMYARGLALIASAFSTQVPQMPYFGKTSDTVRLLAGAFCLAQAFTLTAVAQASFSAMKKSLQYDMFFHMLLAFFVIVKPDASVEPNIQMAIVGLSCLNIALNMWACYYRNNELPEEDDEDEE